MQISTKGGGGNGKSSLTPIRAMLIGLRIISFTTLERKPEVSSGLESDMFAR